MLWPKKNSLWNSITKKNSCASKIPHPPPPSITFLMVCQMRHNNERYLETWHFNYNKIKRANQLPTYVSSTCYSLMPIIQFPTTRRGSLCPFCKPILSPKIEPSDIIHSIPWVSCSRKSCAQTFDLFGEGASKKWIQIIWREEKDIENSHIVKRKPISSQSFPWKRSGANHLNIQSEFLTVRHWKIVW